MSEVRSNDAGVRVESVDILRGLTIFLMIFANTGYVGKPWWMEHYPPALNGMTWVDMIFPAFLFIAGVAVPLAGERFLSRQGSAWRLGLHIATRGASLLAIGVLFVNKSNPELMGWSAAGWWLLVMTGIWLAWHRWNSESRAIRILSHMLRGLGILLLLFFLWRYQGKGGVWIRPSWWGILGLIGWAYMITATCYLVLRRTPELLYMVGVVMAGWMATAGLGYLRGFAPLGQGWTIWAGHPMLAVFGAALGASLLHAEARETMRFRLGAFAVLAAGAGIFLAAGKGLSKNGCTPGWAFLSLAAAAAVWLVIYWLRDVRQWDGASLRYLAALGKIPLTAYIAQYLVLALLRFLGWADFLYWPGTVHPALGYLTTLLFSGLLCQGVILAARRGFSLKV